MSSKSPSQTSLKEVEEHVIDQIRSRRDAGRKKYGCSLERKDLTIPEWIQHAIEEALDFALYLEKLRRELPSLRGAAHHVHGHAANGRLSPTYVTWQNMRSRCLTATRADYADYGGRGITIDPRWDSFSNFLSDMGERPRGLSLDRIDNSKGYSKDNCRWATRTTQANNTRKNTYLTFDGKTRSVTEWTRALNFPAGIIDQRIKKLGWSTEKALTTPARPLKRRKKCEG